QSSSTTLFPLSLHDALPISHYRCVQGFIPVTFWCRDPVAQTIWIWTIQIRNNRIYFPAFGFFLLVFGVDSDTNGKQIIHFFKWNRFLTHLIPNRMNGFWSAKNSGIYVLFEQKLFDRSNKISYKLFAFRFLLVEFFRDKFVRIWIRVFHRQIFQFRFNRIQSKPVCKRSVQVTCFRSYFQLLMAWHKFHSTHIVQTIC